MAVFGMGRNVNNNSTAEATLTPEQLPVATPVLGSNSDALLQQINTEANARIPVVEQGGVGSFLQTPTPAQQPVFENVFEDMNPNPIQPLDPMTTSTAVTDTADYLDVDTAQERVAQHADSVNKRFQVAEQPVNMVSSTGVFDAGVTQSDLNAKLDKVANRLNGIESRFNRDETSAVNSFSEQQVERLFDSESAWSLDNNGVPLNKSELPSDQKASLARAFGIPGLMLLDDVHSKNYLKQTLNDDNDGDTDVDAYDAAMAAEDREIVNQLDNKEVVGLFEDRSREPILMAMVNGISKDMEVQLPFEPSQAIADTYSNEVNALLQEGNTRQEAAEKATVSYNQSYKKEEADYRKELNKNSTILLKDLTDQGYIRWARNKKLKAIPVEGDHFIQDNLLPAANLLNQLYKVDARPSKDSAYPAQTNPALSNLGLASPMTKKVLLDKQGKPKTKGASKLAKTLMESVGVTVNDVNTSAMLQMSEDQSGIFRSTLSEISDVDFDKYREKHGDNVARKIIGRKEAMLNKEIGDVLLRGQRKIPLFVRLKRSLATLRYFPVTGNLNPTTQKGTTRATMSFAGTRPIKVEPNLFSNNPTALLKQLDRLFVPGDKGIARGQKINNRLHMLKKSNPDLLQAVNYYYNLGYQFARHVDPEAAETFADQRLGGRKIYAWSTKQYIEFGITQQVSAAALGEQYINAVNNKKLAEFAQENSWLLDKGEWQYPASVIVDALQIKNAATSGERIRLQNIMEQDARQSNAGIISILIGDMTTAGYLGLTVSEADQELAGLREKIFSNVDTDIKAAFGPNATEYASSWARVFSALSEAKGESKAAKIYSRGLVVAGLYGKTTQKMYSEAQDMINQIRGATYSANSDPKSAKLYDAFSELESLYEGNIFSIDALNDITDILTQASQNNMSKLNGYQVAMKSLGGAMAAINAPSNIKNMLGDTQELAASNYSTVLKDNIEEQVFGSAAFKTEKVAGIDMIQFESKPDFARAADSRLDDGKLVVPRAGSAMRNAWPVDVVQGIDSLVMSLSFLGMNSPDSGFDGSPVQAMGIHDALVTGPEGHLIASNAYNNIAIPSFAMNNSSLIGSILETYNKRLEEVKLNQYKNGANIGTQFVGGDGVNSSFHGLTGYFDRIYDMVYGANSDKDTDSPDYSIEANKDSTFYTPTQLARNEDKRKSTVKSNLKNKAILEAASRLGWLAPTAANLDARKFNVVKGPEFSALVDIMRATSGLMLPGNNTIPKALEDAYRKIPSDYFPTKASRSRHMVAYKQKSRDDGGSTSGMFPKMLERNSVVDNMASADGEITHMR